MSVLTTGETKGLQVAWPGWTSAELDVTIGGGADTWDYATDIATLSEIAADLDTWLAAAGRPWFGAQTFYVELDYTGPPYVVCNVVCSTTVTYSANAALQALMGWPASGQTVTAIYSDPGVPSAAAVVSDVMGAQYAAEGKGPMSRAGAWMIDQQHRAARRPSEIELICDEHGDAVIGDALAGSASDCYFLVHPVPYRSAAAITIYPGEITRARSSGMTYRHTIEGLA